MNINGREFPSENSVTCKITKKDQEAARQWQTSRKRPDFLRCCFKTKKGALSLGIIIFEKISRNEETFRLYYFHIRLFNLLICMVISRSCQSGNFFNKSNHTGYGRYGRKLQKFGQDFSVY